MKHFKGGKKYFCIILDTKCPDLVLLKGYVLLMKSCATGFCLMGGFNYQLNPLFNMLSLVKR